MTSVRQVVALLECLHVLTPPFQLRSKLETSKGDTFSSAIIADFLYGAEDGSELEDALNEFREYAELRKWTNKQRTDLLAR